MFNEKRDQKLLRAAEEFMKGVSISKYHMFSNFRKFRYDYKFYKKSEKFDYNGTS